MTEPQPVEPQPVEPQPTGADLDRRIIDVSRTYIALQRASPRDLQLVADAKTALDDLIAQREAAGG